MKQKRREMKEAGETEGTREVICPLGAASMASEHGEPAVRISSHTR